MSYKYIKSRKSHLPNTFSGIVITIGITSITSPRHPSHRWSFSQTIIQSSHIV